jgi:flagellar biosynthesis protein FlhG
MMTNLTEREHLPAMLCLSSGKGGVGKTSLTVNLAVALAQLGSKVLIVDGDLGLANVDILLGIEVQTTIRDILDNNSDPMAAVVYVEPNLGVLPASSGVPDMVSLGPEDQALLEQLLRSIAQHFDFVIMDTAAGIGPSVLWFNSFVDHNLVVLTPDPTSLTDAYALIKVLARDYKRQRFHLVLNLVTDEQESLQTYNGLAKVAAKFLQLKLNYLGSVPRDPVVHKAIHHQTPFVKQSPRSKAARAVQEIAKRLLTIADGLPWRALRIAPDPDTPASPSTQR